MRLRADIPLETRLAAARDDILRRRPAALARHAQNVARAKRHREDREGAAAALDAIAKTRSYRLDGHRTFAAFAKAELGLPRSTAYRLRSHGGAPSDEAARAAADLARWLRERGIAPTSLVPHRHRGAASVTLVLDARDVAHLVRVRRKRASS